MIGRQDGLLAIGTFVAELFFSRFVIGAVYLGAIVSLNLSHLA